MILSTLNSLSEDITVARAAGFTEDFLYEKSKLIARNSKRKYSSKQCTLVEHCRHEGMSDPADASILFLIECHDGTKGCLTSAYGPGADTELIEFMLSIKRSTN